MKTNCSRKPPGVKTSAPDLGSSNQHCGEGALVKCLRGQVALKYPRIIRGQKYICSKCFSRNTVRQL